MKRLERRPDLEAAWGEADEAAAGGSALRLSLLLPPALPRSETPGEMEPPLGRPVLLARLLPLPPLSFRFELLDCRFA